MAAAILALGAEVRGRTPATASGLAALAGLAVFLLGWNEVVQRWNDEGSRYWRGNWCRTIYAAGLEADARLPKDARIVAGCRGAIQFMVFYYVHRDGFSLKVEDVDQDQAAAPARLEELRADGASFYVAPFNYDWPEAQRRRVRPRDVRGLAGGGLPGGALPPAGRGPGLADLRPALALGRAARPVGLVALGPQQRQLLGQLLHLPGEVERRTE